MSLTMKNLGIRSSYNSKIQSRLQKVTQDSHTQKDENGLLSYTVHRN